MEKKEFFDQLGYNVFGFEVAKVYPEANKVLKDLADNGIKVDKKNLPKYLSIGEADFSAEIEAMKANLLGNLNGILLAEKKRIEKTYNDFSVEMYPKIEQLQRVTKRYDLCFHEVEGYLQVDEEKTESKARKRFTVSYDMNAFNEYWERTVSALKAIKDLNSWEKEHLKGEGISSKMLVLDQWTQDCAARGEAVFLRNTKGADFMLNPNKEYFEGVCLTLFKVD